MTLSKSLKWFSYSLNFRWETLFSVNVCTVKSLIANTQEMWTPPNGNTILRSHWYLLHYEKTSEMWTTPNVNVFVLVPRCSHFWGFTVLKLIKGFISYSEKEETSPSVSDLDNFPQPHPIFVCLYHASRAALRHSGLRILYKQTWVMRTGSISQAKQRK